LPSAVRTQSLNSEKERKSGIKKFKKEISELDLKVVDIAADGNCMFRSIAYLYYGSDEKHAEVREKCVKYMREHAEDFKDFADGEDSEIRRENFEEECKVLEKDTKWGDENCLEALVHCYLIRIKVYDHEQGIVPVSVYKGIEAVEDTLCLYYVGGNHYNALVKTLEKLTKERDEAEYLYEQALEKEGKIDPSSSIV